MKDDSVLEAKQQPKYLSGLTVAIASRGLIDTRFMINFHNMQANLPTGLAWKLIFGTLDPDKRLQGYNFVDIDHARQSLAEYSIKSKSKYTLFLDDDVFPPADAIKKIMFTGKDVVTGIYWTKRKPPEPVIYEDFQSGPYMDFPQEKIFKVKGSGLGFCLIKNDVFKKIEKPWFKFNWKRKVKGKGTFKAGGEDLYFFQKLDNANIPVWCDSSILCDHLDMNNNIFYPGPSIIGRYRPEIALEKSKINAQKHGLLGHAGGTWETVTTLLPPGKKNVLNVGCGEFVPDFSGYKFYNADQRENYLKIPNYKQCNLNEKWPYNDNEFDGVLAIELIEHLENPRHFMREATRVAKDFVVFTFPNCESPKSVEMFKDHRRFTWFRDQDYHNSKHITPIFSWQMNQAASEIGWKITTARYNNFQTQEVAIMKMEVDKDVESKGGNKKGSK